jgi:inorganic pyrophosphatase
MDHIPVGKEAPETVNVIVEILAGSKNKYEYDEELNVIKLDRVLYASMMYPYDYGFIPGTRSEDGDHLDAFIICDHSFFPGCVVEGRPIGVLEMIDGGERDEKIICVPYADVRYNHIKDINDLSPHIPVELKHFFEHYKDLQGKKVEVKAAHGSETAHKIIREAIQVFKDQG